MFSNLLEMILVFVNNFLRIFMDKILLLNQLSGYFSNQLNLNKDWHNKIIDFNNFNKDCIKKDLNNYLDLSENEFLSKIRKVKHFYQVLFIYQLFSQKINQKTFLYYLTILAEVLLQTALDYAEEKINQRFDLLSKNRLTVLAMGKLGGEELNFSSDVDVILVYKQADDCLFCKNKTIDLQEFCIKIAQKWIHLLTNINKDGWVYRVDTRLRPFGQQSPLVLSDVALLQYYQNYGRDWERYALMKARPVAGDIVFGKKLIEQLTPFIYRRVLDYRALTAIVVMKEGIAEQIGLDGSESHIKLGWGGIREAEFAVQAMQMIYGGQYPALRHHHIITVIQTLESLKLWNKKTANLFESAYLFLRMVENALQIRQEQQTHQLPSNDCDWKILSDLCGFSDVIDFKNSLSSHRQTIHQQFLAIFSDLSTKALNQKQLPDIDWQKILQKDNQNLSNCLILNNVFDHKQCELLLQDFLQTNPWQMLDGLQQKQLSKLLSVLIYWLGQESELINGLSGVLKVIGSVINFPHYLLLLADKPSLIKRLLVIGGKSSWLMNYIADHPIVIDSILNDRLDQLTEQQIIADLEARLGEYLNDDAWLNLLHDFKHDWVFKVAWADQNGQISLMQVSDYLTVIAEQILMQIYKRSWQQLADKYGVPKNNSGEDVGLIVIGYGKLGGLELSYSSDLDLVFLYGDQGKTDGSKSLENEIFFQRLVQKFVGFLSKPTADGTLYAVDVRLRPEGKAGLPAQSLASFFKYQTTKARIWEHQALTRARVVLGDVKLTEQFNQMRITILTQPPSDNLRDEVLNMREKMRSHQQQVDLKHQSGGLIDIEFMVQYLVLQNAHEQPILVKMSDNIRQLAALEAVGIVSSTTAMELRDGYRKLRQAQHNDYLQNPNPVLLEAGFNLLKEKIIANWIDLFDDKQN